MNPWTRISNLNKDETLRLQGRKLHSFLNHYLYPFSSHYRALFDKHKIDPRKIKSVDDLKRLPFSFKADFIDEDDSPPKFKEFIQRPCKETIKRYWPLTRKLKLSAKALSGGKEKVQDSLEQEFCPVLMTFTTGTTNNPIPFLYTNHDIQNMHTAGSRMMHLIGIDRDQPLVNIFPFAPHLAFWQVVFGGLASNALILSTGGGKTIGTQGNIAIMSKIQPSVILGVPSYVYHLLRTAKEKSCDMSSIKNVVLGASRVTVAFKKKLAELLWSMGAGDVSVFGTYGLTEARCAWIEAPTPLEVSSGYHLYPDLEIFEVIDPKTGEVQKEGQDGELVYTSIDSRGSSVVRYRTGDFVKGGITYEPCRYSNLTVPRISSDITRLSDVKDLQLSKVKGTLVNFSNFEAVFAEMNFIDEWQVEIRKKNDDPYDVDEMIIYCCVHNERARTDAEQEIKKQIMMSMEVTPNRIEFVSIDEMVGRLELEKANKEKRIVDGRPKL